MPREIAIRPHVGVFALFSAVDYKAWYAIAEFADNSIQSFLDARASIERVDGPTHLTLEIDPNAEDGASITIRDDAGGIPEDRIEAAFQVATPPPDSSG